MGPTPTTNQPTSPAKLTSQFPYVCTPIGRRRLWLSEATFHGHSRSRTSNSKILLLFFPLLRSQKKNSTRHMTHTYDDISRFRACSTLALALPVRCARTLSLRAPRCLARAAALRLCCSGACSGVISGRKSIQAREPQRSAEAPGDHAAVGDACASSRSNVEGVVCHAFADLAISLVPRAPRQGGARGGVGVCARKQTQRVTTESRAR